MGEGAFRVLFVCSGNTCRSPLAAAIFARVAEEEGLEVEVDSAGLEAVPGLPASEEAVAVAEEMGLDLSGHRSKGIWQVDPASFDLVVAMTMRQKMRLLEMGLPPERVILYGEVADRGVKEAVEEALRLLRDGGGRAHFHRLVELGSLIASAEVEDPFGEPREVYERVAERLSEYARLLASSIKGA